MKVHELSVGMLLQPCDDVLAVMQEEKIREAHLQTYGGKQTLIKSVRFYSHKKVLQAGSLHRPGPWVYLGYDYDPYCWEGIWKHHRILAQSGVLHLSGYDVRFLEPVPDD